MRLSPSPWVLGADRAPLRSGRCCGAIPDRCAPRAAVSARRPVGPERPPRPSVRASGRADELLRDWPSAYRPVCNKNRPCGRVQASGRRPARSAPRCSWVVAATPSIATGRFAGGGATDRSIVGEASTPAPQTGDGEISAGRAWSSGPGPDTCELQDRYIHSRPATRGECATTSREAARAGSRSCRRADASLSWLSSLIVRRASQREQCIRSPPATAGLSTASSPWDDRPLWGSSGRPIDGRESAGRVRGPPVRIDAAPASTGTRSIIRYRSEIAGAARQD